MNNNQSPNYEWIKRNSYQKPNHEYKGVAERYTQCVHFNNIYVNIKTCESIHTQFTDKHEVGLYPPRYDNVCFWGKTGIILGRDTDGTSNWPFVFFLKQLKEVWQNLYLFITSSKCTVIC